jgi:hypothetical protein
MSGSSCLFGFINVPSGFAPGYPMRAEDLG